jgi:hypothetical protein
MKPIRVISATALFLVLGMTAAGAQEQQQEKQDQKAHPPKREQQDQQRQGQQQDRSPKQEQQAKGQQDQQPQQRQQQDKPSKQDQQQAKGQQDQQRRQRQQQDRSAKQEQQQQAKGQQDQQRQHQANRPSQQDEHGQAGVQRLAWQQDRAHTWQSEHHTWEQRGGYNGYHVPDDRFRSYYGQQHGFRIYSLPVMYVGGHRRFQYGGYWFGLVDPWPEYWSNDWYDNDDVYVDYYGDGYYLYNRRYPGDRIAITFYLD